MPILLEPLWHGREGVRIDDGRHRNQLPFLLRPPPLVDQPAVPTDALACVIAHLASVHRIPQEEVPLS